MRTTSGPATDLGAYNANLDKHWKTLSLGSPDDVGDDETRICFRAKGPAEARIPRSFVERSAALRDVTIQDDGFWHFEALTCFGGEVLRIRPVPMTFWDGAYAPEPGIYAPKEDPGNRKFVARSTDSARPTSFVYSYIHVYFTSGPVDLVCWLTNRGDIYVRRRYSEETWAQLNTELRASFERDPGLYLGLPS